MKKTCRNCKFNMDGKCDELDWVVSELYGWYPNRIFNPLTVTVNPNESLICFNKGRNFNK